MLINCSIRIRYKESFGKTNFMSFRVVLSVAFLLLPVAAEYLMEWLKCNGTPYACLSGYQVQF